MATPPANDPPAHEPAPAQNPPVAAQQFAPVARVPWVNPARRSHVVGAAIAGALVTLVAGVGIGYAAAPDHHRHDRYVDYGRMRVGPLHHAQLPGRMVPMPGPGHYRPLPQPPAPPTSAPSASPTR